MQNTFYFGFVNFADFLAAAASKTVYLSKSVSTRPGPEPFFVEERSWYVTAASVENGVCHYFRLKMGARQIFGEPFPEDEKYDAACNKRYSSALDALTELAREQNIEIIPAMSTFPENLVLLSGGIKGLDFDEAENNFSRDTKQKPAKLAA